MKKAVLALNGELTGDQTEYNQLYEKKDTVFIGADGGALFLEQIGLQPDVVIGDLDSLSSKDLDRYDQLDIKIIKYPVDKDETDGELALNLCQELGLYTVTILGSLGGRYDQQLANIFLLEYALKNQIKAIIREPGLEIGLIKDKKVFLNKKGSRLSVLPVSEKVVGISNQGCKYPLDKEVLYRYKTRGISNLIQSDEAEASLEEGLLLYVLEDV